MNRQAERPGAVDQRAPDSAPALSRRRHECPPCAHCRHQATHSEAAMQHAREDAGQQQLGDRDAADHAEDDEADAGRDDRPDDRAAATISPPDVALSWPALLIIGISSADSAAASADRRARQRRQDAGRQDRHIAQAAAHMADEGQRHIDDAARQAAGVHDLAGQHEERHGHQREAVGPVDDVLRDDLQSRRCRAGSSAPRRRRSAQRRSACRAPWRPAATA